MKVLVVDDEQVLVKGIRFNLEREGYEVICGYDGDSAVELTRNSQPDLVILDLMMPKQDGFAACMKIRTFSDVPIIMLTAKDDDMDKIMGFEYGADDYVTKPFNVLELKARVRALLRRTVHSTVQAPQQELLKSGALTLDLAQRSASVSGKTTELTAKEFDLLELLMRNPGRVYSRENLLDKVWGYEYQGDYRTVDVHVRRLREKIEENSAKPKLLLTKWGVGYYLSNG